MNISQGFKMAWKSIGGNKMRSFLTMLGIIIGVGSVIGLVSLGQGSTAAIKSQVESLGTNLLTLNIVGGRGTKTYLTYEDSMKFAEIDGVDGVSPVVNSSVTAKYGAENESVSLEGITPEYEDVRDYHVQEGRFLLQIDVNYRQKVALIGTETATNLFGTEDPVGKTIQLNGLNFQVVGLLATKGSSLGGSNDDKILIPLTTAERLTRSKGVRSVYIQAKSPDDVDSVMDEATVRIKQYLGVTQDNQGYRIFNQQDALDTVSSVTKTTTMMMGGIAGISLLVGGIGIMNIMLVSVSERTREIGIRKAIGAKKRDILFQFLIEAMVLGGFGGVFGILVGAGGSGLLSKFMKMNVSMSAQVIVIAFCFSLFVGVLFGLLPANKASNLKPIEALRFE